MTGGALPATVHGGAVVLGECGVLIRGASGAGKSALALALLTGTPPARLVADDRVILDAHHARLVARPAPGLEGRIELRGQGILPWPSLPAAVIRLVVDLVAPPDAPRLPDEADAVTGLAGVTLPRLVVPIGAPDVALRVRLAAARLADDGFPPRFTAMHNGTISSCVAESERRDCAPDAVAGSGMRRPAGQPRYKTIR